MGIIKAIYNLLPLFDRHCTIQTNILVPGKMHKNIKKNIKKIPFLLIIHSLGIK